MKSRIQYIISFTALFAIAGILTGCGGGGTAGTSTPTGVSLAKATFVLANSDPNAPVARTASSAVVRHEGGNGGGPVPISDILSLTVTITQIYIQYCEPGEDDKSQVATVELKDFEFDPHCITVEKGDTVRWEWTTDTPHTITSGSPGDSDAGALFDKSGSGTGTAVELIFADTGTFPYFSDIQADIDQGMSGVVHVVDNDGGENHHGDGHQDGGNHGQGGNRSARHDSQEGGALVNITTSPVDVNLLDLTVLSQVLTTANLPAGKYCRIRLTVENPRLVLNSDPNTVITNIHLTANGKMFIKDEFEVQTGQEIVIVLDFGGIHLIKLGNGSYVLTPKIRAEVNPGSEEVDVHGQITSIDAGSKILEVEAEEGGTFEVLVDDTTVITTGGHSDRNTSTPLTFADLAKGQEVHVDGTLGTGGQIVAHEIRVENFTPPV